MHNAAITVIYNPNSTGKSEEKAKQLVADLAVKLPKAQVDLKPTERAGHAIELAYEAAKKSDQVLIVSVSGDGGYHEVINGAMRAQNEGAHPICAVLPAGNANDHASALQDQPLIDSIVAGNVNNIDLLSLETTASDGTTQTTYAHSYLGIGLTPAVAVELNKHTLNALLEAWTVLKAFWNLRPVRLRIDNKITKIDSLICSTIPRMAKVLTLSEDATTDDGLFEIVSFPHNHKLKLILKLLRGTLNHLQTERQEKTFSFTVLDKNPLQLDGEVLEVEANTQATVRCHARLLRTII